MAGLLSDAAAFHEQLRAGAAQDCEAFLRSADLGGWQGSKPRVLIEHGEPDRILYDYASEEGVDLVAFGTHGRSALFEVLIGGVAQRLLAPPAVRHPRCPGPARQHHRLTRHPWKPSPGLDPDLIRGEAIRNLVRLASDLLHEVPDRSAARQRLPRT